VVNSLAVPVASVDSIAGSDVTSVGTSVTSGEVSITGAGSALIILGFGAAVLFFAAAFFFEAPLRVFAAATFLFTPFFFESLACFPFFPLFPLLLALAFAIRIALAKHLFLSLFFFDANGGLFCKNYRRKPAQLANIASDFCCSWPLLCIMSHYFARVEVKLCDMAVAVFDPVIFDVRVVQRRRAAFYAYPQNVKVFWISFSQAMLQFVAVHHRI
jgi:hypothetical protein